MKRILAAAAILLAAGCDRMVTPGPAPIYAPWEEGLTLVYQDPAGERLQMRVKKATEGANGRTVVETFSTLSGVNDAAFRQKDGLVALKLDGQAEIKILPEGFPDRVSRWEERGAFNFVVGRSKVDLPGVKLPDPDAVGIWYETVPATAAGVRRRTLLVPNYGEVETLNWKNGKWVVVNILVSQGFTEAPATGASNE